MKSILNECPKQFFTVDTVSVLCPIWKTLFYTKARFIKVFFYYINAVEIDSILNTPLLSLSNTRNCWMVIGWAHARLLLVLVAKFV